MQRAYFITVPTGLTQSEIAKYTIIESSLHGVPEKNCTEFKAL